MCEMQCNMQEGIKDGRRLRPGGLVFYRGPDARSHLKLQNIQVLDNIQGADDKLGQTLRPHLKH